MDNQQPSFVQEKVQRPSRKRVLSDYITWETPRINMYYVYKLTDALDNVYYGITKNIKDRLWQHVKDKTVSIDTLKMHILYTTTDREEASKIEMDLIQNNKCINKVVSGYTRLHRFYNVITSELMEFNSTKEAKKVLNTTTSTYDRKIKYEVIKLYPKESIEDAIKRHSTIKAKHYKGKEYFFVSQKHAAITLGVSANMINLCVMGQRKSVKGYQIKRPNEEYIKMGKSGSCKRIKCLETGIEFNSIQEASEILKLDETCITRVLKGKRKHTGGYSFKYL